MLYPHAQCKWFGFHQDILPVQHFKNIPGRMSRCQDHGICLPGFADPRFNAFYLAETPRAAQRYFGIKMYFAAGVQYRFGGSQ